MRLSVLLQCGRRHVRGIANVALVPLDVLVNLFVDEQVGGMGEAFAAEATFAIPDPPVDVHVLLELVLIGERFRALIAVELAEFLMDYFHVILEDGGRGKFSIALLAMVQLVVVAIVGPHEGVRRSNVFAVRFFASSRIAGGISQSFRQNVRVDAVVWIVGEMDLHVNSQISLTGKVRLTNLAGITILLIVLLLQMTQFMLVVLFFVVECPLAVHACIQRVGQVNSLVTPQDGPGLKGFGTSLTFVPLRITIPVSSYVLVKFTNLDEYLSAFVTCESLFMLGVEVSRMVIQ